MIYLYDLILRYLNVYDSTIIVATFHSSKTVAVILPIKHIITVFVNNQATIVVLLRAILH